MKKFFVVLIACLAISTHVMQAGSNPSMSRVYANQFTPEQAQTQSVAAIGTLDNTFGSSGVFSVNSLLSGGIALGMQPLQNGNFLVVVGKSGSAPVIGQYNAQGVLVSQYGSSGVTNLNASLSMTTAIGTMLDVQGRLLVAGGNNTGNAGIIYRIPAAGSGSAVSPLISDTNFTYFGGIAQQSTGQIIGVGFNGSNAQVARYNLDGSIDTSFASSGYFILNGSPASTSGLYSVLVDGSDNIYALFIDTATAVYIAKISSVGVYLGTVNSTEILGLQAVAPSAMRMAFDVNSNIIVAGVSAGGSGGITPASGSLYVTAFTTGGETPAGWSDYTSSNTDTIFGALLTSSGYGSNGSNGYIYIAAADSTAQKQQITRLMGNGSLDSSSNDTSGYDFNTSGYNQFNASAIANSALSALVLGYDGQLYTCGKETTSTPTTTPYVYRLNNNNYVSQPLQFPVSQEQGILDQTFGLTAVQTYPGVVTPYNGIYGSLLQQKIVAAVEVTSGNTPSGDIILGMNGKTNSSNSSNMMLAWLSQEGALDTSIANNGYLVLDNASASNEFMTNMVQDGSGNLYVTGYKAATYSGASTGALLRVYTSGSTHGAAAWSATGADMTTADYQGIYVTIDDSRTLMCVAESSTVGHISSYIAGILDTSFGDGGSGYINATSFGLHMGPCYSLAVTDLGALYTAYVDSSNQQVTLVKFLANGSALDLTFNTTGMVSDIFNSYTVNPNSVRIAFNQAGNVVVAATGYTTGGTAATDFLLGCYDATTGAFVGTFNGGSPLVIPVTGATSLTLTRLTGVSDGTVLLTAWDAASDETMIIARVVNTGSLDTSFNSQGDTTLSSTVQPGVLSFKIGDKVADYNARVLSSAVVQSTPSTGNQGNIVLVGYESVTSSDATPMAMHVFGDPNTTEILNYPLVDLTPGVLEAAYNLNSSPLISPGFGKAIFVYPATNSNNGKILVGIDNGTTSEIARLNESDMTLDATFGSGTGIYSISGSLTGISHISIDANNNILVGGSQSGAGWAQVIDDAGTTQTSFDFTTTATNIASVNTIYQQKSGRYIVAATEKISGKGLLVAFQDALVSPATSLAVDPTFNPLSVGSVPYAGCYYLGATGLSAIAINSNDTIVAAYANTASPALILVTEITADGSGPVSGFNSGAPITTAINTDNSSVIQLNIDSVGNVVVGTSYNNGSTHQLQAQRYDSAGGTTTAFNGVGVVGGIATVTDVGNSGFVLTGLMETTTQQTILTGYNAAGGNGPLFAVRLLANGALDTSWNTTPTYPDIAGILTYTVDGAINANNAALAVDGTLLTICSTDTTASTSDPIVTYISGDTLVTQSSQNPLAQAAGTKDSTIPGNIAGALPLATLPAGGLVPGVPARMYVYNELDAQTNPSPNGALLIASADSSNVYVTLLNSDLSLYSGFGSSGTVTIANANTTITDLYVANGTNETTQPIYVTGYTSGNVPWAVQILSDGSAVITASPISNLTTTGCIRQSTNNRILVSGYDGSSGVIVAYNSSLNAIDTSFGNNNDSSPYYGSGYYATGVNASIVAMATDNSDRIYIAYKNGSGGISIERLLENGTAVDSTFSATFTTATNSYSASQIKMAVDFASNYLVVAAQDGTLAGNILQVARFNLSNGNSAGAISTIALSGAVLNLKDLCIDNDQNIYVIGYVASGTGAGNTVVARVQSQSSSVIALDTAYANAASPQGIANVAIGNMSVVTAGILHPDKRVYLVGSNGLTTGYMGRLFGDNYWNQLSDAILQAQVGTMDLTLNPNFTGGLELSATLASGSATWSSLANGYQAQAIIENANHDGSSFIAFGNGSSVVVGKLTPDILPASGFGTNGLTSVQTMATVNSITQDANGNIIVSGTNAGSQRVMLWNSSGVYQATFATELGSLVGTTVVQQKSGRYIVGGYNGSANGIICAYKNPSAISGASLPVDYTFGPNGSNGYYAIGIDAQIDDLVIDNEDYIYYVYRSAGNVYLAKLMANGSQLVSSTNSPVDFNGGAVVDTGITNATQPARIAINSAGNILVGASTSNNSNDVQVQLFDGSTGATIGSLISDSTISNTSSPVLTKLVGSGTEFYGSVFNTDTTPQMLAFAVTNLGEIDSSFGLSGLLITTVESAVQVQSLSVQNDGKIVMVGYNNQGSGSSANPILIRGYGYPYVAQYNQAPMQAACGTLDNTIWPSSGAYQLDNIAGLSIPGYALTRINPMSTNQTYAGFTIVADDNTLSKTTIFQLAKDFSLRAGYFGSTGYNAWNTGHGGTTGLFTNPYLQSNYPFTQSVYLVGNDPNNSGAAGTWAQGIVYKTDGSGYLNVQLSVTNFMASVQAVNQQSNDRVLVAGLGDATLQGNTNGYILGLTTTGSIDVSFASTATHPGMVDMGVSTAITDITVDAHDNIIAVSNNSGSVVLQKVAATGLGSVITSSGTAVTGAVSGSNIKVALDSNGYIIVAAATTSGFVVRSYNNDGTLSNNAASAVTISAGTTSPAWVLSNIYTTSDGKITLIGYDSASGSSTAGQMMVARFVSGASSLTLDTTTFDTAGTSPSGQGYLVTSVSPMDQFLDAMIDADARMYVVGSNSSSAAPYMTRVFGDNYVSQQSQSVIGIPGTLDVSFGSANPPTGYYNLSTLGSGALNNAKGAAILSLTNGGYYQVVDNGTNSLLLKVLADGSLDTAFNSGAVNYDAGIAQSNAPTGTNFIMMNGSSQLMLVGNNGSGGFVQRYQSGNTGAKDTTFGSSGVVSLGASTTAMAAIEQTLGRLVVAGENAAGNGTLFGYESLAPNGQPGDVDVTFNNTGSTPGQFSTGIARVIPSVIADQYDRLIFASLNATGDGIDLYRLTPSGQLDVTFGSNGKVANVLTTNTGGISGNIATSIRVALDSNGNIVVAAYTYNGGTTTDAISITARNNGISTATSGNGALYTNSYTLPNLNGTGHTGMSLSEIVTAADGTVLLLGNCVGSSSATSPAWVARFINTSLNGTYALDTTFNPNGSTPGVFKYTDVAGTTTPYNVYNAMAINAVGGLGLIGYEQTGASTYIPSLLQVNNDPYTTSQSQSPDSKPVGSNDVTLGVSTTSTTNKGIIFYGTSSSSSSNNQVARAVGLYDDNNIVVAIDGVNPSGSVDIHRTVFIDLFNNDGLLYNQSPAFGSNGRAVALAYYQNQYVNDMITFTTVAGVHKAILAGYGTDTTLGVTGSLLFQYILTPGSNALDSSFGGFDENPSGVAFGDGQQACVVGQQTMGRIVVGGLAQGGAGLLLGYSANGKLDTTFGNDGYQSTDTGETGIYTHTIDTENRIIIAYNDGSGNVVVSRFLADGSALDTTFGTAGSVTTQISGLQTGVNNNFKVALDNSGNIIVAAVTGNGTTSATITVWSYDANGSGTLNYQSSFTGGSSFAGSVSSTFTIGKLLIDQAGNAIIVAYDSHPTPNTILVARVTSAGALDTTFNTNGYLTYQVASGTTQVARSAMIHPDGRIIVVGNEQ